MSVWDTLVNGASATLSEGGDLLNHIGEGAGNLLRGGVSLAVDATQKVGDLVASKNPGTQAVVGLLLDKLGLGVSRDLGSERPESGQGRIRLYDTQSGRYSGSVPGAPGAYGMGGIGGSQVALYGGLAALGLLGVYLVARK